MFVAFSALLSVRKNIRSVKLSDEGAYRVVEEIMWIMVSRKVRKVIMTDVDRVVLNCT